MNAVFEEVAPQEVRISRRHLAHWDLDNAWPGVETQPATMWHNAVEVSPPYPSVYGEGRHFSTTQLAVLDFIGERQEDVDAADEFVFTAKGTVRAYGIADRNVFLRGRARTVRGEQTPFLEHFHGHAIVSDDNYRWSINSTNLFRVTGVAAVRPPARRARYQPPSRAYKAFKELGDWLEMSYEELGPIVGVSRGTVSTSWKRGIEPRKREVARRLFQLHGLVSALRAALGGDLMVWLKRGSPCPLKLLEKGDIDTFEQIADQVIFPSSTTPKPRLDAAWPASHASATNAQGAPMRSAVRVRSRRLER